ncbi:MAG: hypothetical protein ACTHU0_32955 [Kofleriaceae bacterium]
MHRWIAIAALCAACKGRDEPTPTPPPSPVAAPAPAPADATRATPDAPTAWSKLDDYPRIDPARVIALPARPDVPRFDVGGPVLAGDLAVVSSSQFGFIGADWRRGAIAWTKPAGAHVAPPAVRGGELVLIGDCLAPPAIPEGQLLLGCLRIVSPTGVDRLHAAIRGRADTRAFAASAGTQSVWVDGDGGIRWRRGEHAVAIDPLTGAARPASATPPPIAFRYRDRAWSIAHDDGRIVGRNEGKRPAWSTEHEYSALVGLVWTPEGSPLVRVANLGAFAGMPELHLIDIDATGSLRGMVAKPVPAIGLLGWGTSTIGDAAIALRMDTSIQHDFIAGYAANAMLMWVFPLPEIPRADPVGIALAPDAVVVFHDGDTLTILPELSAPPTAPGAGRAASQIPTP